MRELTGMHFSPWTERARWALDHHGLPYRYIEYTTLLGEPLLRLHAKKPFGKVSVPFLKTPEGNVDDSFEIAGYADRNSGKAPLLPAVHADAIRGWGVAAEHALCAARIRATRRIRRSTAALADRLPAYTPGFLRKPFVPMAYVATTYILQKYRVQADSEDKLLQDMDAFFGKAAQALKGREFVFDQISFADIVIATALQAITPVDDRYIHLGAPSRACMCEPELARKYASLLAWRDDFYEKYR